MNALDSTYDMFGTGNVGRPRDPLAVLRDIFGHQNFRGQQEKVVRHVTDGNRATDANG